MSRLAIVATLSGAPGALERTLSLLRRRALPIESLSVSRTSGGGQELCVRFGDLAGPEARVEAEILSVVDVVGLRRVQAHEGPRARELALAQVVGDVGPWPESDHGRLSAHGEGAVELTGSPDEIDRGLRLMAERGVLTAAARTGELYLPHAPESTQPETP